MQNKPTLYQNHKQIMEYFLPLEKCISVQLWPYFFCCENGITFETRLSQLSRGSHKFPQQTETTNFHPTGNHGAGNLEDSVNYISLSKYFFHYQNCISLITSCNKQKQQLPPCWRKSWCSKSGSGSINCISQDMKAAFFW